MHKIYHSKIDFKEFGLAVKANLNSMIPASALILLMILVPMQLAFGHAPGPTITFKGLDAKNCKKFEIKDSDGISQILIDDGELVDVTSTATQPNPATNETSGNVQNFTYNKKPGTVNMVICSQAFFADFTIIASDAEKKPHQTKVEVLELKGEGHRFQFFPTKKITKCEDAMKKIQTNNFKITDKFCTYDKEGGFTNVLIDGEITDPKKPSTMAMLIDPPAEFFLLVGEICVVSEDGTTLLCPTNVEMDIEIVEDAVVGAKILDIDMTTLFVAGVQANASWILLMLAGIAGILVFAAKFRTK